MKLQMQLNNHSIQQVIDKLNDYKNSLNKKNQIFIDRLKDIGLDIIQYNIDTALGDGAENVTCGFQFDNALNKVSVKLYIEDKVTNNVLFLEFGAGYKYNPSNLGATNPLGKGQYGIGTYPGQTHAYHEEGWWYTDDKGEKKHSYGTQATMPLYKAQLEIMSNVTKIAKEVFGNG